MSPRKIKTRRRSVDEGVPLVKHSLRHKIEYAHPAQFRPHPCNTNEHSKKQKEFLKSAIAQLGFINPVLVNDSLQVVAGHLRVEVAQELRLDAIPYIRLSHLSPTELRALMIGDNAIASHSKLNDGLLADELSELMPLLAAEGHDVSLLGIEAAEIDLLLGNHADIEQDPDDELPEPSKTIVSTLGDLWVLGDHVIRCGDAKSQNDYAELMGRERATVIVSDPPYNLPTRSFQGRGKIRHANFVEAFGEMSPEEFTDFLTAAFSLAGKYSRDGALHYYFGDWRHAAEYIAAGKAVFSEFKNLIVWNKTSPGQGSLYKSQHELVFLFKNGRAPHVNNVELGRHGRNRSNIWVFSGANSFRKDRLKELSLHPTVKPIAMIADALKDASRRGDIVLDPFAGSGSTLLAAERVGRRARVMDLDPQFVDVTVRRWQDFTRRDGILRATGQTFDEVARERARNTKRGRK
jgi:DNA modification methylase